MTYLQLYDKARKLLDNSKITLGEYLDMIKPLGDEIIVRCKDCEWRYVKGNTTNYYWCRENDCPVDDNDFCSWAKMKGGDDE